MPIIHSWGCILTNTLLTSSQYLYMLSETCASDSNSLVNLSKKNVESFSDVLIAFSSFMWDCTSFKSTNCLGDYFLETLFSFKSVTEIQATV